MILIKFLKIRGLQYIENFDFKSLSLVSSLWLSWHKLILNENLKLKDKKKREFIFVKIYTPRFFIKFKSMTLFWNQSLYTSVLYKQFLTRKWRWWGQNSSILNIKFTTLLYVIEKFLLLLLLLLLKVHNQNKYINELKNFFLYTKLLR